MPNVKVTLNESNIAQLMSKEDTAGWCWGRYEKFSPNTQVQDKWMKKTKGERLNHLTQINLENRQGFGRTNLS